MENKTAGELMIPLDKYPHVPYWFTIRQAVAEIQHSELSIGGRKSLARAVLVFDEEYKLLGLVRRRDILFGLEPDFGSSSKHQKKLFNIEPDPQLLEVTFDHYQSTIKEAAEYPVSSIMIPIEHAVDFDDHIIKIIYEMNHNNYSMVPVLKDGVVVGVVRTVEVINEIAKVLDID